MKTVAAPLSTSNPNLMGPPFVDGYPLPAEGLNNAFKHSGTVTSVSAAAPLTGGTITTSGTIGLGTMPITMLKLTGGAAGYVIQTDGAGNLSFVPPGGGPPPPTGPIQTPGGGAVETPGGGAVVTPGMVDSLHSRIVELEARLVALEGSS